MKRFFPWNVFINCRISLHSVTPCWNSSVALGRNFTCDGEFLRNVESSHQKLEAFFQIIFLIKYFRRSLSIVEPQTYSTFTKAELFAEIFKTSISISKSVYFIEQLSVVAYKTREFKHMYQIYKIVSVSLVFEKLLIWVTSD